MIPKAAACVNAVKGGVKKAHILDASIPHALLLEIFTDKGIGTEIVK
jgi:acetylglutamate kinase